MDDQSLRESGGCAVAMVSLFELLILTTDLGGIFSRLTGSSQ